MNSENPTEYDRGKATGVKLGALIERRRIIALLEPEIIRHYELGLDASAAYLEQTVAKINAAERKEND